MKNRSLFIIRIGSLVLLTIACAVKSENSLERIDQLKAVYLFNFTKYISWPNSRSESTSADIRICVDAPTVFREYLAEVTNNRRVGKSQRSVRVVSLDVAEACELVYLGKAENTLPDTIKNSVIVADATGGDFLGPDIIFYTSDKKLRFEIDLKRLNKKEVFVSSELLKLAKVK